MIWKWKGEWSSSWTFKVSLCCCKQSIYFATLAQPSLSGRQTLSILPFNASGFGLSDVLLNHILNGAYSFASGSVGWLVKKCCKKMQLCWGFLSFPERNQYNCLSPARNALLPRKKPNDIFPVTQTHTHTHVCLSIFLPVCGIWTWKNKWVLYATRLMHHTRTLNLVIFFPSSSPGN